MKSTIVEMNNLRYMARKRGVYEWEIVLQIIQ